jgi:two-component system cell cycle sensor histidine kinase/response regulator CckA
MCTAQLLVVDDEALVREVAKRALESVGFQVHFARHGAEALEILNAVDSIDLVISDVVMPVMGGVELGRQLAISHADLPLIWVSGHPREALSELLGTDDYIYLQKPVMPEVLAATVEQVLSSAGLDRVDR